MEKKISLYCRTGGSNKEYHIQLIQPEGRVGWVVNFQYGAIGGALKPGTKTPDGVPYEKALKIYEKLVKEKLSGGYQPGETADDFDSSQSFTKEVIFVPMLLDEIREKEEVYRLLTSDDWMMEEKMDGERRMIFSQVDGEIFGVNKKGQAVPLPKGVMDCIKDISITLDGEIIGNKVYVWDVLRIGNSSWMQNMAIDRKMVLDTYNFVDSDIVVIPTAYTTEEKNRLFEEVLSRSGEGVVFKRKDGIYVSGRTRDVVKKKFKETCTCKVIDTTPGKRSVGLAMILGDDKLWFTVGKVTIPPNKEIPKPGSFVEVQYLYYYPGGSLFQPVYLGERHDVDETDCDIKQLKLKPENQPV